MIHGVLGENGAGKSTLMKILIGLVIPDAGSISVDGARITINDPTTAAEHGIGMVHQHFSLVEPLRVWENVVLGDARPLDRPNEIRDRVAEICERYGLERRPRRPSSVTCPSECASGSRSSSVSGATRRS